LKHLYRQRQPFGDDLIVPPPDEKRRVIPSVIERSQGFGVVARLAAEIRHMFKRVPILTLNVSQPFRIHAWDGLKHVG
jgi:hypothetical protein